MAFRVADAAKAHARAVSLGAKPVAGRVGPMELSIPAISGIGGSLLYFVDRYGDRGSIYDVDFEWSGAREPVPAGDGLTVVDHLTHSVHRGRMDVWSHFYEKLFNFRQISYFEVEGRQSGVHVRAMTSPCGQIRIPITESADDTSQIEEYLHAYNGEGVQHIALGSNDIFGAVETMRRQGVPFMETPATYYELLPSRMPDLGREEIARLARNGILTDGAPTPEGGRLLQIFTATLLFPIFFEIIQRKGDRGFGEGNVKALFESAELEQMRRGTLPPKT
jgi:4-hydroxyphenylpyruvate dioxygenase